MQAHCTAPNNIPVLLQHFTRLQSKLALQLPTLPTEKTPNPFIKLKFHNPKQIKGQRQGKRETGTQTHSHIQIFTTFSSPPHNNIHNYRTRPKKRKKTNCASKLRPHILVPHSASRNVNLCKESSSTWLLIFQHILPVHIQLSQFPTLLHSACFSPTILSHYLPLTINPMYQHFNHHQLLPNPSSTSANFNFQRHIYLQRQQSSKLTAPSKITSACKPTNRAFDYTTVWYTNNNLKFIYCKYLWFSFNKVVCKADAGWEACLQLHLIALNQSVINFKISFKLRHYSLVPNKHNCIPPSRDELEDDTKLTN